MDVKFIIAQPDSPTRRGPRTSSCANSKACAACQALMLLTGSLGYQVFDNCYLEGWLAGMQAGGICGEFRDLGRGSSRTPQLGGGTKPILTLMPKMRPATRYQACDAGRAHRRRSAIAAAAQMLGAEAAEHGDLVVVRGADAYRNLPNKTVRLLRYMLSSARGCASWARFFFLLSFFFFFWAGLLLGPQLDSVYQGRCSLPNRGKVAAAPHTPERAGAPPCCVGLWHPCSVSLHPRISVVQLCHSPPARIANHIRRNQRCECVPSPISQPQELRHRALCPAREALSRPPSCRSPRAPQRAGLCKP